MRRSSSDSRLGIVRDTHDSEILVENLMSKKRLCDLKKWLKRDLDAYLELVSDPNHICTSCGRVANCKKRLCDAQKLPGHVIEAGDTYDIEYVYS